MRKGRIYANLYLIPYDVTALNAHTHGGCKVVFRPSPPAPLPLGHTLTHIFRSVMRV